MEIEVTKDGDGAIITCMSDYVVERVNQSVINHVSSYMDVETSSRSHANAIGEYLSTADITVAWY